MNFHVLLQNVVLFLVFVGPFFLGMTRRYWAYVLGTALALTPFIYFQFAAVSYLRGMEGRNGPALKVLLHAYTDKGILLLFLFGIALLVVGVWLMLVGRSIGKRRETVSRSEQVQIARLSYRVNAWVAWGVVAILGLVFCYYSGTLFYKWALPNLPEAAQAGRLNRVVGLLEKGGDPNEALYHGAWTGHIDIVEAAITHGADVNAYLGSSWKRSLHSAAGGGHVDIVKLLLEEGADATVRGYGGGTPVHSLFNWVTAENPAVVEEILTALINNGAEIDAVDQSGSTALLKVARQGSDALARMLIEHGADPLVVNEDGKTSLHVAARHGEIEAVRVLLKLGINVNVRDSEGRTPLHMTATGTVQQFYGQPSEAARIIVAEELLNQGAKINAANNGKFTTLHHAARGGHEGLVRFLLERGANPLLKTKEGKKARDLPWLNQNIVKLLDDWPTSQ